MRYVSRTTRGNQRARRCRGGDESGADELGEAMKPGFVSLRRGAVPQQLVRHEERSCRAGRRVAQRGGSAVPRRVKGGGLLFAEVVLGVDVVVVCWVLDAGLGVDAALRSSASARVASRRSGGGAGRPASETFGAHFKAKVSVLQLHFPNLCFYSSLTINKLLPNHRISI